MITVHKGHTENSDIFRLVVGCDRCHTRIATDVPLHNIRDQGDAATEPYLKRAREELGQSCPHIQEELERQEKQAQSSQPETGHPPHRHFSYDGGQ